MSYVYRSSINRGRSQSSTSSHRGNQHRGKYIDPALFVRAASPVQNGGYQSTNTFSSFRIAQLLKQNLSNKGYKTPTPIQDQTIALALENKDIIGIADTGTGKTAAFAIPVLNQLMETRGPKALIIAPTRELAQQIQAEFRWMAAGSGITTAVLIGGSPMYPQLRDLRANPRIVVGTPGRIKDHIERRSLQLSSFNIVVLDEVDRMLDMGFVHDVRTILSSMNQTRQSYFFSATLDSRVNDLIKTFSSDPVTVSIKSGHSSENVHQNVVQYQTPHQKMDKLHDILIQGDAQKILVFDETRRSVERLGKELVLRGFKADAIHGGKSQSARQRALNSFKNNEVSILVATDVAARGIDIADITHVINYSLPKSYEDYIHRVGRAGRAGQIGHALTFVTA